MGVGEWGSGEGGGGLERGGERRGVSRQGMPTRAVAQVRQIGTCSLEQAELACLG